MAAPPNRHQHQPQTQLPDLGDRFPVTAPEPRVIDQAQMEAALARLPAPLAAQLARLASRYGTSSESTAQTSRRDTPHL